MNFVVLIKEQLIVFFESLRRQIAGKHEIVSVPFPPHVEFDFGDFVKIEVPKLKLETTPSFKPSEYGFQCRLVQSEKIVSIHGFCFKNFEQPDSNDDSNAVWGKVVVNLATLSKASEKLSRGLEHRSIKIGLSREYIRKVGDSNVHMSYIQAGNGFLKEHWHEHSDIEEIIKHRLTNQKLVKLAGDHKDSEDKIYCGRASAYIEQLDKNDKWVKGVNVSVVNETEGITSPGGVKASKGKGSGDVERSEEAIVAHVESSEGIESFGGYGASGGAEYLGSVRGAGGAVGSESVERPESAER